MTDARIALFAVLFGIPALFLAVMGVIHLRDGMAIDAAFPVPVNLSVNNPLPGAAYADAAAALRQADPRNGAAKIALAESVRHDGSAQSLVETGLQAAPASAEGWTFYAETLAAKDPRKAGMALDQAFALAPYDWFWTGRRVQLAARLWDVLGKETRSKALRQARNLWDEKKLRDQMMPLFQTPEGRGLMMHAYAYDPRALTAITQWMMTRREQIKAGMP